MSLIYLDNNATTPMLPQVAEAMRPYLTEVYGNPASAHQAGRRARQALEDAREKTAGILDAHPDEAIFTSGGTDANNLALFGLVGAGCRAALAAVPPGSRDQPGHIIISPIEHPSVAEPIQQLEKQGFMVDRLTVNREGVVQPESLLQLLRAETRLVTVMMANNEVGSIQPIAKLVQLLAAPSPLPLSPEGRGDQQTVAFHCDAVQAVGRIPVSFKELGVTTLSLSAHKFHGPKGVGALLIRRDVKLRPQMFGGHQQQGRRPGTEPVALAVGLATALELWREEHQERTEKVRRLRRQLLEALESRAAPVVLNGPREGGIPHTLNISFPGCRADSLLMSLDLAGVACSTGSACSSGSLLPSPVLKAMGVMEEVLHSAMRFSLSSLLMEEELAEAAKRIAAVVCRLRKMEA